MFKTIRVAIALVLSSGWILKADTQRFYAHGAMSDLTIADNKTVTDLFKPESADLINGKAAKVLVRSTVKPTVAKDEKIKEYAIIHVVYWSKTEKGAKQTPVQKWYVFHDELVELWSFEDFSTRDRIFGQGNLYFLYVHLNKQEYTSFEPAYDIEVKGKLPSNLLNLFAILGSFQALHGPPPPAGRLAPEVADRWGGLYLEKIYKTSDITITPAIAGFETAGTKTFDNEGKAHWDISAGVPLRKISEVTLDTTNNTISPKQVDKHNVLALANFYLKARDLKTSNFQWTPSLVTGVALAQQPLHKILVAAGWGPAFAQFYIGSMWVKEASLQGTVPSTVSVKQGFSPKFAIGINLPVRAIQQKLNGK